jgi:hypothetical protein
MHSTRQKKNITPQTNYPIPKHEKYKKAHHIFNNGSHKTYPNVKKEKHKKKKKTLKIQKLVHIHPKKHPHHPKRKH